jgi:hypothetical protein
VLIRVAAAARAPQRRHAKHGRYTLVTGYMYMSIDGYVPMARVIKASSQYYIYYSCLISRSGGWLIQLASSASYR